MFKWAMDARHARMTLWIHEISMPTGMLMCITETSIDKNDVRVSVAFLTKVTHIQLIVLATFIVLFKTAIRQSVVSETFRASKIQSWRTEQMHTHGNTLKDSLGSKIFPERVRMNCTSKDSVVILDWSHHGATCHRIQNTWHCHPSWGPGLPLLMCIWSSSANIQPGDKNFAKTEDPCTRVAFVWL